MTQVPLWRSTRRLLFIMGAVVATHACHAQIIGGVRYAPAKSYDTIFCFAFSPDGEKLLAGNNNGPVSIFKPSSGQKVGSFFAKRFLSGLCFSPKGDVLAGYCYQRDDVFLWETKEWKPLPPLRTPDRGVTSIAISSDGRYLAAACNDSTMLLWDLPARKRVREIKWERKRAEEPRIQFSPDSKTLAAACGPIELWDARTGRRILRIAEVPSKDNPEPVVRCIAFHPNGKVLFSAETDLLGHNGKIRMWDATTGRILRTLEWEYSLAQSSIDSLIPLPGDKLISACYTECTIRLWDMRTFKEIGTFEPGANVNCVTLSPNGEILAAKLSKIGMDTWKVWNLTSIFPVLRQKKIAEKDLGAERNGTVEFH